MNTVVLVSGQFAAETGHWYDAKTGEPRYTIIGANGKERNTTLRDARKLNLYPSVTSIIRLMDAPGLTRWKMRQLALSCLTLPRIDGESEDDFLARAEQDSKEEGKAAAERGTDIHAAVERHYRGDDTPDLWEWVKAAKGAIDGLCGSQEWSAERSFSHPSGYGGKVDLHSSSWVLDVKTKDDDKADLYDEHFIQLAAYATGLNVPEARCGIVFVNRREPRAIAVEASPDDIDKGRECFAALLALHKAKHRYRPS